MSPQPQITALFEPLEGLQFESYVDLEHAVRERFRAERRQFPSEFGYRDAISWATDQGVITVEGDQLVIRSGTPTTLTVGARVGDDPVGVGAFSPRRVVVLSGRSRSGKSLIAAQLAEQPGWARASCGEYVIARAKELGIPPQLPNTHELGQQLVEKMGGKDFLEAVLDFAQIPADAESVVIDDVYHVAVFEALRERWQGLTFTTVDLPESVRRSLLHEQGLDDEQVDQLEGSPLDQAVERLEREYTPEIRLTGAASPAETDAAIREIGEFLAAA